MVIHLRSYHRKWKKIRHPLLDGVKPVSKEQAALLVADHLKYRTEATRHKLIMANLSAIRYLMGRYVANWPVTRKYLDEMVSVALLTTVKSVDNLTKDTLQGRSIIKVISQRVCKYVEIMLYEAESIVAPKKRTQERHAALGVETPYLIVEADLSDITIEDNSSKEEQDLFDTEEALSVMTTSLKLDVELLKPEYHGMTAEEAGARLGVHHTTILRRRAKLRSIYKSDFGG